MNALTKSFGFELLGRSLVAGVFGLGYSSYYRLDKKIAIPFFIINMIFFHTAYQCVAVEKIQPSTEGEQTNFKDVLGKELKASEAAIRQVLAQTALGAIMLIAGRQLGILGTKATVLMGVGIVCMSIGCGISLVGTKFLKIGVQGKQSENESL